MQVKCRYGDILHLQLSGIYIYLALEKGRNGCVNEYPEFIPESVIGVSE